MKLFSTRQLLRKRSFARLFCMVFAFYAIANSAAIAQTALNFTGTQSTTAIPVPALQTANSAFTVEIWVKPGDNGAFYKGTPVSFNSVGGSTGKFFIQYQNFGSTAGTYNLEAFIYGTQFGGTVNSCLIKNVWNHVAVVVNPAANDLRIYVNGILKYTYSGTQITNSNIQGVNVQMGAQVPGGENMIGAVDELRVWQGSRTTAEIFNNYFNSFANSVAASTPNLLVDVNFEGESPATQLTNRATNNGVANAKYAINGASYITPDPFIATALNFDGSNDYVSISNPYKAYNKDITVEFWMNPASSSMPFGSIMGQGVEGQDNMTNNVWLMHPNADGTMTFYVNDAGTYRSAGPVAIQTGWHHIAGVANASGTKLYVDGVLAASGGAITGSILNNPSSVMHIGKDVRFATGRFGNLSVDEVRVWSRSLCQSEIQNNMNCNLNPTGQTGLVGLYRLDNGTLNADNNSVANITVAADASGNGNNGTLFNFGLTGASSNYVAGNASGTCSAFAVPTSAITGTTGICINGTTTLANSQTGGSWTSSNTGVATINASTGVVTGIAAGTTTITYTNSCGGVSTATVTVNAAPTVNAVANQEVCHNGTATTAISFSGPVSGTVYNWTNNTPSIGLAASGSGNIASFVGQNTGITPVTATITVTPTANGCTGTPITFTIRVNPIPTFNAIANQTVCNSGATTAVTFVGQVAGTTYTWSGGSSIGLANGSGATLPSFTAANAGTSAVTANILVISNYAGATNSCGTSRLFTITVNPTPTVSGVSGTTNVCTGSTTTLTAASLVSNTSFKWYDAATGGNLLFTGAVFTTPAISANTTYYIEANSNGCVSASRFAVGITTNALPAVSGITGTNSVCSGNTASLTASSLASVPTYNWYAVATGGTPLFTGATFITPALSTTTTYYAEVVSNGCISGARMAATVKVITINDQSVTASPAAVCGSGSSVITVGSSQTGVKYTLRNNANNAVIGTPVDGTGSSISFNTGTISSTTTYNVLAQNTSGALNFDGLNNYVTINSNTAAMGLAGNSFTVSAWIYRNNNVGGDLEIFGNQGGCNLHLLVRNSQLYLGFCGNDIAGSTIINANQWYHVAFTYNASTQTQAIYVNGVLDGSGGGHSPLVNDGTALRIGGYGSAGNTGGKFPGKIDELQIWNSAQTAAQISAGMNNCLTGTESGLIAYYNFDQGSGLTLTDITGHGFNGVLTNMTGNEWTSGNVTCGATCSLQMGNTPTVTVNPIPTISGVTGTTSICSGTTTVLTAASAATSPTFNWYTTSTGGTPIFTGAAFTTPALTGTTTYYVEVVSGSGCVSSARTATTVNVTTINDQSVTVSPAAICGTGSATVSLASSQSGVSYTLRNNANNGVIAGPVAGTGAAISFNTGSISSTTTYNVFAQTGGGGGALNFNGSNNYLTAPHTASLNLSAGGQLTMEAWVNPGNANNWRNVMMKGSYGYGLAIDYANRIYFWDQGCGGCNDTWSNVTVPANQWSHIAVTVQDNGSSLSVTLYLNGVNVGNKTSPQASINDNTEPLYIGTQGTCFCNYYSGKMDDLRLWNTVRTQAQIQASMNSCLTGSETGLVANYKFDETSGATAADARSANNATLFNFTLPTAWTSGTVNCGTTVASCSLQMSNTPTVTVNPIPTVSGVSGTTTICTGGTTVLTAASSASAPTFNWYNASSGGTLLFTGATYTTPALSVATTYYVEVASNGCTSTSRFPVSITLTPLPTPTVSSNGPVCSGNTLTLSASGATNYSWTGPNGFTSTLQNPTIPNVTTAATGTYIVTASNNGCTGGTASTVVSVVQTPSIPIVSAPAIVCAGSSATITATTSTGNIVWWNAPTGGSIVGTGSPFTVTPGSTTTYYAEGSVAGGAGVIVNTLAANALTAVEIASQTGDDRGGIVVTQASVFVNGDGGVGRFDHNLNIQAGLLPQRDGIFCDINPSTAGQLWTLWNTSSNSSPNSLSGVVNAIRQMDQNMNLGTTVTLSSSIDLGTNNAGIFSGSGYVLLFSSTTNSWYTIDDATGTVTNRGTAGGGGLNAYPTENWARWGWAEFNGTDYFAVYRDASSQSIVKKNISTGAVTTLAAYTNLADMANIIYSPWDNRAYLHHEGSAQFRVGDESLEDVTGTSTTGGGATCASTARTGVTLTVVALPVATITAGGSTAICPGTTVTLSANSGTGFTYQWYNNGQIINGATAINYIVNNSGNYTVIITNSNGCASAPSNAIVVNTDVQAPSIVCAPNQSLNLNANCSVSLPDYRNLLGVSDNCTATGSLIITQSPAAGTIVSGTGTMTVSFTVTDASGNSNSCSITVTKKDVTGPVVTGPSTINVNTDPNKCGAVVNYAGSNSIVFSQNFVSGPTNSTYCNAWTTFINQLAAGNSYTKLTIKGTFDQVGINVTDPAVIAQIANALRTGGSGSWFTNGRTWSVGNCGGPGALSATGSLCSCESVGYVVRPCINEPNGGNPNWGGVNTNVCNGPSQNITVVFDMAGGGGGGLTATDACSGNTVTIAQTAGLASGATFPVGTTTNTFVATDASGNQSTYSFNVVVTDNQLPVITVPSNITTTATGASGAVVNYATPTATDNCSVSVALTTGLPSGSMFPLGPTTVTYTATDASGNTATGSFTVTVSGRLPVINCPVNIVAAATNGVCGANVNFGATETLGVPASTISYTENNNPVVSGSFFTVGTHTITAKATNIIGSSTCSFTITVNDNQAPIVITRPVTVYLDQNGNASITAAQVNNGSSDNCEIATVSLNKSTFNCNDLTNTVQGAGNAMFFNGGYIDVPHESSIAPLNQWTIETWVKTSAPNVQHSLIEKYSCNGSEYGYLLRITSANQLMAFALAGCGGGNVTGATTLAPNTWYHVAATFNRSTGVLKVYVNGVLDGTATGISTPTTPSSLALRIGARGNDAGSRLQGWLDEVRVWDIERSQAQIQSTKNSKLSGTETGLQAYYSFEEAIGSATATDGATATIANTGNLSGSVSRVSSTAPINSPGTQVVLTVTDINGNSASAPATVTVLDIINPVVTCPVDISVNNDPNKCGATVSITPATATDNCSVVSIVGVRSDAQALTADYPIGTTYITWTATDASGNKATCKQTIIVTDNQPPVIVCPGDMTVIATSAAGAVVNYTAPVGTDNCTGVTTTLTAGLASGSIFPIGPTVVTYTATDAAGLTASCSFNVLVKGLAPVINCPANIVVSSSADACGANVNYASTETTGIPASTITYSIAPGSFFPVGTTTVTATATNAVGTSICTFTVKVVDDVVPVVITKNITIQLDATGNAGITPAMIDNGSTDNCSIATYSLDKTSFDCSNVSTNTVTLTVTDIHGNISSATAIVTVEDKIAPTVITQNITIQLDANGAVSITPADINNGSVDNCSIATYSLDKTSFNCGNVGENTVTLTVTDVNGNSSTATAVVMVQDNVAPTVITQNITVQLDANGHVSITPAQINNGSTDNCSIATYRLDKTGFDCSNVGDNTVILTVTDVNGNVSTGTAVVAVEDHVAPTVITQNITVQLDANGAVSITPADINNGSTDNCSIATYSLDKTSFDCSNTGTNPVTLTVTDVNGNVSTGTAVVTVEDHVAPIVITQNITVQLDASGNASIAPAQINNGSTDNCAIATYSLNKTSFDCSNVGDNTVTLTVTDVHGNISTATAVVTIEDKFAPTVITQNITVQLDANGNVTITPAQVNNGSTDNCAVATYSLDKTNFDCSNVGTNTVILTATDVNGNQSSATAVVTIEDHIPAVVLTNNITIQLSATGAAGITVADINNGSHDACGIASMVLSKTSFDCSNAGDNTVILTVTDVNGNVSSNTAVVTVKDVTPAVVLTKNITIQLNASGSATIAAADVDNGSNDACGIAGMVVSPNVFSCANVGTNTVTLTVTDVNGNVSSNTAVVTVQDQVAPVVITKNITINLDGTGHVSISAADVNSASSDACGIASMSVSPNTFSCSNLGANTVILTVTDVNGNTSTNTAVVTVQDKLGPVPTVNVLPTITGQCSANIVIVGATCTDNCRCCRSGCHCHDNCRCHRNDYSYRSWNSWSWWWNNDDDDNDCENDADDHNTYYMSTPTAMDNCSGLIKGTTTDPLHYNTQGTYIINWKFVDANGNITIQPQTVIVNDNQAPIPWVSTLPTITGQCSVTVGLTNNSNDDDDYEADGDDDHDGDNDHDHWNQHHRGAPWAWDNCAGWVRGTTTDPLTYSTQGTYVIHWKFSDGHGNTTIQNQTVIVKDVTAPKPLVKSLPTLTGSCSVSVTAVPTAKDNCIGIVNGTTNSPLTYTAQGTYTIVWTYNDGRGNISTQTQKVVVDDVTKPVPQVSVLPTITGECSVTVASVPKANDNCKGVIIGTTTDPLTYSGEGTYTIHWSYNDGNGNIATQNQTVVINDVTAPVPQVAVLPTLTGECSVTATAPKANDNCKGVITATTNDALTYTRQGTYTIHWSYNDGNGNISTQNQTVVVDDNTKPLITAPLAATVSCGGSTAPTVSATATDNCSGAIAITYSDVTSGNTITRTWKATDAAGNFSTAIQTLTIVDNTAPVITDPRDVTVSCGSSTDPSVTGRATATDNCSTPTVTYTDAVSGYTITRTWTAKDASNNMSSSTQVITIVDNTKPTITDIADITVNCGASTLPSATGTPTATDNCSAVTITSSDVPSGNTIIRTWTAKDASGNTATSTQVITIGSLFSTTVSSIPTSSTYTGGVSTNLYLGYGAQSTTLQVGNLPAAGAPYTYAWSGSYTNRLSSTTSAAPVFTPSIFGYYTFNVTVTNKYGCTFSCGISICVTDVRVPGTNGAKIYVTHTPNGKNAVPQTLQVALSSVSSHIGSSSCGSNGNDRLGSTDQSPCNTTIANATGVTNSGTAKDGEIAVTTSTEEDLKVTAMPNPSTTFFTLKIESRYQTPVELRVMDGRGRVVDAKSKIGANSTIQIGHSYSSGTYYAELIQGTQRKVVQLIKARG